MLVINCINNNTGITNKENLIEKLIRKNYEQGEFIFKKDVN